MGEGSRGMCFSSSDKSHYLHIKLQVCTALFKLNHLLAFLHIWTKEKNWRTSSYHDKHCIGAKMTAPHPSPKTGLTPLFWPLPFLSQDILSCITNLGQTAPGLGQWLEFLLGCSCHQSRHDIGAIQWPISHTLNSWSGLKPFIWSLHLRDYKIPWESNYKQLMKWCWFQLPSFPVSFATFAIPRLHLLTLNSQSQLTSGPNEQRRPQNSAQAEMVRSQK